MTEPRIAILILVTLLVPVGCGKEQSDSTTSTIGGASSAATATSPGSTDTALTSPGGTTTATGQSALADADREFVLNAARVGMAEVQLATNVTSRAKSQEVKAFARKMIEDHNRANQELMTLAASKGVDLPADLDPAKKALDAELASLFGVELDRRYMEAMVKDHVAAAADFERAAQSLVDPDLKAWAAKTLPVLHEHHHGAEAIVAKLR